MVGESVVAGPSPGRGERPSAHLWDAHGEACQYEINERDEERSAVQARVSGPKSDVVEAGDDGDVTLPQPAGEVTCPGHPPGPRKLTPAEVKQRVHEHQRCEPHEPLTQSA